MRNKMFANYEYRKVGRYEFEEGFLSTCQVGDSKYPYESAISHKKYNNGEIIIIENYNSEKEAKEGHEKWKKMIINNELPSKIEDVGACFLSQIRNALFNESIIYEAE